jgi:hypothetical protein
MASINEKSAIILEHEKKFANTLALHVLDKPKLSVWMILIPIIFVYYFYQYQKFTRGQKIFAEHYLFSKKRALTEAVDVVNTGKSPDFDKLVELSDMTDESRMLQKEVCKVLVEHFITLLRSEGEDFESLVKSAYGSRMNYLLFINRLNQTEKAVNKALKPQLKITHNGINDIVNTIELQSDRLRRKNAENIFP